jgi:signal transduction histidine kinase
VISAGGFDWQTAAVWTDLRAWRQRLSPLADPALAGVVFVLSLLPLIRATPCGCDPTPAWGFVLVAAQCLPLVVRRHWPFAAPMLCGFLSMAYGASSLPDPPVQYAGLVALYTVAAHATRRLAYVAGAIAAGGLATVLTLDWPKSNLEDLTVNTLVFATAWLLGDNARSRRDRALELELRANQLELTRAAEAEAAVVAERNRIAREMHDVIAHHVSMMVVQAESGPIAVERDPQHAIASFDAISTAGKQALSDMRRLLGVLRDQTDPPLAPQPGADQIPDLVAGVRSAGLDVHLDITGQVRVVPPAVDLSAYRLVQEALTNCLRHAGHAQVAVSTRYDSDALRVEVIDDGVGGGAPTALSGGNGLIAMRERVAMVGGTLEVGPRQSGGWSVRAVLPLAEAGAR